MEVMYSYLLTPLQKASPCPEPCIKSSANTGSETALVTWFMYAGNSHFAHIESNSLCHYASIEVYVAEPPLDSPHEVNGVDTTLQ